MTAYRVFILTGLSLLAFASNSVLCRVALAEQRIDAASFTAIRLLSGAVVLAPLAAGKLRGAPWPGSLGSTAALFLYAAPFSFAYLRLGAGMGALVLFGCVQATMISWGVLRGERSPRTVWFGLALALAGLIGLTAPGGSAPDPLGAALMTVAGIAWGVYSLRGRSSAAGPLATTSANFLGTLPAAALLAILAVAAETARVSASGVVLAVLSGALASGVGYSLWYAALRHLTATRAAALQLLVPVLAAIGGVLALGEAISLRLVLPGSAILAGVAIAIRPRG